MKKYITNLEEKVSSVLNESLIADAAELVGIEEEDAEERIKGLSFANYIELGNAIELEDAETVREILSTVAPIEEKLIKGRQENKTATYSRKGGNKQQYKWKVTLNNGREKSVWADSRKSVKDSLSPEDLIIGIKSAKRMIADMEETAGAGGAGAGAVGVSTGGDIGTWDGKAHKKPKKGLKNAGKSIYEDGGKQLYHVTHTKYVPQIQRNGLRPMGAPSNWVQQGSGERYGMGEIYLFTNREDAKKWAARMDWDFNQTIGSGEISIITLNRPEGQDFEKDESDPMSQAGQQGEWLKTYEPIEPENIVGAQVFKSMKESISEGGGDFGLLTPEEMQRLPTPRLLAYYKAKRKESKQNQSSMYYDGDGEYSAELDKALQIAKNILNTREHLGEDIFDEEKLLNKPTPTLKDLAKKHDVPLADMGVQLAKGIKIEKEHTSDMLVAKEIALDHLNELPDYYDRLEKVEEADNPYASPPSQGSSVDALAQQNQAQATPTAADNEEPGELGRKEVDDLTVGDNIEVIDIDGDPTPVTVKTPRGPGDTLVVQTDKGEEHIVKKQAVSGTPTIQEMYEAAFNTVEEVEIDEEEISYESALTERSVVDEVAPPGMEDWIKKRKPEFKKRYGDDWESVLYATAWKQHNNESIEEGKFDDWEAEDAETLKFNFAEWADLGFKKHRNWPGGTTLVALKDLRKDARAKFKLEGWQKDEGGWWIHPDKKYMSTIEFENGATAVTSMPVPSYFKEARNASNTEHSGAKKGKGGYYGRKKDAKSDSNKKRRQNDKKAVDEDLSTHVSVEYRDPDGKFIVVGAKPAGYWAIGQGHPYSENIDRLSFKTVADAIEHAELTVQELDLDEGLDLTEVRRLAGLKETASAGATGAGAVATAPTAMGGMVKRSPSIYDKPKPKKRTKESSDDGLGRSKKK